MSLSNQPPLLEVEPTKTVISASRRTDLAACFPDYFTEKLSEYPPERVHTVVVWTKNPHNMLTNARLRAALGRYSQLYVQLTITGLGGTPLEPHIPPGPEVVAMLPELAALTGDPRRITWRFDPIIRTKIANSILSNFELFPELCTAVSASGIPLCRTSWVEPYRKVQRRLAKRGVELLIHAPEERFEQARQLSEIAARHNITMQFCAMDGFERSRCIDGELLSELHPSGARCSTRRAKGQRKLCGCTESIDIGWYSLKCPNGCLYCYAEPLLILQRNLDI